MSKQELNDGWRFKRLNGFSLVELLAVIGIIGILLALTFPAAQAVRQAARRTVCLSNIRQVMTATLTYEANTGKFPAGASSKGASFVIPLLAHMEEAGLQERANQDLLSGESFQDRLSSLGEQLVETLICPASGPTDELVGLASQGTYTTHYFGVAGPAGFAVDDDSQTYDYAELNPAPAEGTIGLQGLFSPGSNGIFKSREYRDILDGISNTLAFGEISGTPPRSNMTLLNRNGWAFGASYSNSGKRKVVETYSCKTITDRINEPATNINNIPFRSNHPGGAQFAFADGSTHFIEDSIGLDVLKILASIDAGETYSPSQQ